MAMRSYLTLLLVTYTVAEWIPLQGPEVKKKTLKTQELVCPDIHNLTMAVWGKTAEQHDINKLLREQVEDFQVPKSPGGRFAFLKAMKDNLMFNIEKQITTFGQSRSARGKMIPEIPREAALISISLLLFAVYLIKLITKVLEKIQEKKQALFNNGALNLNNVRVPPGLLQLLIPQGRRRRDVQLEQQVQHIQWLYLIDKYHDTWHR